jgi:hypothetical protein
MTGLEGTTDVLPPMRSSGRNKIPAKHHQRRKTISCPTRFRGHGEPLVLIHAGSGSSSTRGCRRPGAPRGHQPVPTKGLRTRLENADVFPMRPRTHQNVRYRSSDSPGGPPCAVQSLSMAIDSTLTVSTSIRTGGIHDRSLISRGSNEVLAVAHLFSDRDLSDRLANVVVDIGNSIAERAQVDVKFGWQA